MIRTFLALDLSQLFAEEIKVALPALYRYVEKARWVKPEQIHLTLHFFGSTLEEDLPRIYELISSVTNACPLLSLELSEIGFFPNAKKPRVLWLGVKGDTELLIARQKTLETQLSEAGFPVGARDFKPHATLARTRPGGMCISGSKLPVFGSSRKKVTEWVLFKSTLTSQGSIYEILKRFPLCKS